MITKSPKTTRTQWKIRIFPHESHEKSPFVNNPVSVSLLSGDRKPQIRF